MALSERSIGLVDVIQDKEETLDISQVLVD